MDTTITGPPSPQALAERSRVLFEWNRTACDFPHDEPVHRRFEEQASRSPDAPAVFCRGDVLTFAELDRAANRLAHALRRRVAEGSMVRVCAERSLELVVAVVGVFKAGLTFVPLDPANPPERLSRIVTDGPLALVLAQGMLVDRLRAVASRCLPVDDPATFQHEPDAPVSPSVAPGDLAYVFFTSGTTGQPKGVMVQHDALSNATASAARRYELRAGDRTLVPGPLAIDGSISRLFSTLGAGGAVVLPRPGRTPDLFELLGLVREHRIARFGATPPVLALLNEMADELPPLRLINSSGDQLLVRHVDRLARVAEIMNLYGPTETTVSATAYRFDADHVPAGEVVPIGRPLENYRTYVLDAELGYLPPGEVGELCVGGVGVARGYLNDPVLTRERFVPDPFVPGERIYRTGDQARWRADGTLEFVGRIDRQVKVRGFRLELGEVEAALSRSPDVREAAVVSRVTPSGDVALVAYVVARSGRRAEPEALRAFLRELVPEFMVPSRIVPVDTLPLTPNAKRDYRGLASDSR